MRTTIDSAGRIVIPKKIRDRAGLAPGAAVEIHECDGRVEIEAIWDEPRLEWRDGFLVAVPPEGTPPLTAEDVSEMLDYMRVGRLLEKMGYSEQ
jgi:AbrB family looped-hinge helix DNA binding protein